ncbi:hypothetical protein DOM21_16160 [Bacteriovorax stolpii]|nr:hypothetical protein DOM21_16160 [Bacteriovorax stolpii]
MLSETFIAQGVAITSSEFKLGEKAIFKFLIFPFLRPKSFLYEFNSAKFVTVTDPEHSRAICSAEGAQPKVLPLAKYGKMNARIPVKVIRLFIFIP